MLTESLVTKWFRIIIQKCLKYSIFFANDSCYRTLPEQFGGEFKDREPSARHSVMMTSLVSYPGIQL